MSTKVTPLKVKLSLSTQNYDYRKYKILQLIDSQPFFVAQNLRKKLPSLLGISRQQFSNYCNVALDSTLEIPANKLLILATLFNVNPFDLVNIPSKPVSMNDFIPKSFTSAQEATKLTR